MRRVPRHRFVPDSLTELAYADVPLSIGYGQTISQPSLVVLMTEALELHGTEKVLEIGTGSGYQTAVLAELASKVFTIELLGPLAKQAAHTLTELGYKNVQVRTGDGYTVGRKTHPSTPSSSLRQLITSPHRFSINLPWAAA
jgi:protein-L-isoaspartate(D-aspartate) O-methyltransferase